MNAARPAIGQFLFEGASGKGQPGAVYVSAKGVGTGHPNHDGRGFGHGAEAGFAFAQGLVGALAFDELTDLLGNRRNGAQKGFLRLARLTAEEFHDAEELVVADNGEAKAGVKPGGGGAGEILAFAEV